MLAARTGLSRSRFRVMAADLCRSIRRERPAKYDAEQRKGRGAGEGDSQIQQAEVGGATPGERQIQQACRKRDTESPAQLLRHTGNAARRAHPLVLDLGVNNGLRCGELEGLEKAANQQ